MRKLCKHKNLTALLLGSALFLTACGGTAPAAQTPADQAAAPAESAEAADDQENDAAAQAEPAEAETAAAAENGAAEAEEAAAAESGEKKTLNCAIELAYVPFDYKDEAGEPTGVDVDLIRDFGEAYGYEINIEDTAWDGLIPALQTGKADLVISAMSVTEERDKVIDFSDPYALAKIAILASASSKAQTDADFDSPDITIAVKSGTVGHIYAEEFFPQAKLTILADESACIQEVLQGKADGFLYDELTCTNYHAENPDKTKCIPLSHAETGGWAVAVAEGNTALKAELDAFIEDYYKRGKLDELGEKYMPGKKQEFAENGFQWFFDLESQYQ